MRGLGGWYLYEIALWLDAGSLLRYGFRNRLKCHYCSQTCMDLEIIIKVSLIAESIPVLKSRDRVV